MNPWLDRRNHPRRFLPAPGGPKCSTGPTTTGSGRGSTPHPGCRRATPDPPLPQGGRRGDGQIAATPTGATVRAAWNTHPSVHGRWRWSKTLPWPWLYPCATSRSWAYRALLPGKQSIHRTAGYVTRSSDGGGGRGREASASPDWASFAKLGKGRTGMCTEDRRWG